MRLIVIALDLLLTIEQYTQALLTEIKALNYSNQDLWPSSCREEHGILYSPIDLQIKSSKLDIFDTELKFNGLEVQVEVELKNLGFLYQGRIMRPSTVTGGPLIGTYSIDAFYLHQPSEHTFTKRHFPLEIEFPLTPPVGEKMFTLGVIFEFDFRGIFNLSVVTDYLYALQEQGTSMTVKFELERLLPYDYTRYYYYKGSSTLPPCKESYWIVFEEQVSSLSEKDISRLQEAHSSQKNKIKMGSSNRVVQHFKYRDIFLIDSDYSGAFGLSCYRAPISNFLSTLLLILLIE